MATHIMEWSLLLCCLVALVMPANSLKCITCAGDDCSGKEVTCPGDSDKCSTTALYIDSFPCKMRKVFKGCINSTTTTTKKLSISPSELTTISLQQEMCDSDLCNTHEVPDIQTVKNQNDLYCHSCISPGDTCSSAEMKELQCKGEQNKCVDMGIIGPIGDMGDVNIKGCAHLSSCSQDLVFSSQASFVSVRCCNENFCNSATDYVSVDQTPNGIQCYSCNTQAGAGCSPEEVVKDQCYGDLTSCLEVAGTSMKDGLPIPSVIKGCATQSMCNSSVLPMLQKLGTATVKCCKGNLCNNQFSESDLKASGYLPIGNASPGTGIQNPPSFDATSGGPSKPVKSKPHDTKKDGTSSMLTSSSNYKNYKDKGLSEFNGPNMSPGNSNVEGIKGASWNSNSNSGYPNPSFYSYNEFSNSGSVYNPSITTSQDDQVISYNDLSVENPYSVYDCNLFSPDAQATGNDVISANNESPTLPSPINYYSSDENNVSALSPGGSALSAEGVSHTTIKSSDDTIPNAPPTLPDFTTYVDNSNVPNSYYDNNTNNLNHNDISSYESVGFTEIVYIDTDWNDDQSSSSTMAPDISNGYDTIDNSGGDNSAYNPNISLSANNNETSGYSADTVNMGRFVNVPENNGNSQNLTSTTAKTHNSAIEQHMSESYNESSPINYSSGENNLSTLSPGASGFGEGVGTTNYSNINDSTILNVPPTVPDFTSYVDNSVVPNSYYDNNMNNLNHNDVSSYESVGFTEVVYIDTDWNDDQSSSSTMAPDISNGYDTIGNSEGDHSAYNPHISLSANNNETSGYSTDTVIMGSFVNAPQNNGKGQHLTSTTAKTQNSAIEQQISEYGTDISNTGISNNNGSVNNISSSGNNTAGSGNNSSSGTAGIFTESESPTVPSPINYSSGEYNLSTLSPGGSGLGGEGVSDTTSSSDNDNVFNAPPTFLDNNSSYYDNNMDNLNHNDFSSYESVGFTEIVDNAPISPPTMPDFTSYVDNSNVPNSYYGNHMNNLSHNDFSSYESADFTNVSFTDIDSNDDQFNSQIVTAGRVVSNSYDSVGNSGGDTRTYDPNIILLADTNETSAHLADTVNMGSFVNVPESNSKVQNFTPNTEKTHNSSTKEHISGYGTGIYDMGIANNNGSGNYISSSGNNTAGSGKNSSAGTSGSSSFGGYTNIPGSNESSTTHSILANGTGMTNAWNNSNNSSSHNMVVPVGYANIPGANNSSTSYESSSNGTEMTNQWINSNDSSQNMATHVGYNNMPGNNDSSTSYTGNGTGMSNDWSNINSFNPNNSVPVGSGNISVNNDSTAHYTSSGNGTGIANERSNSSFPNMSVPGGYANIPGNNDSTTYYTSSGSGTGMASDGNSSNPNLSVPGGNANMPGSNNYSTSYSSSDNGTGMTNEWLNNSSYHNMASPGGHYGSFNSNGSNHFSNNNYSSNSMTQNNGSTYGNGSNFGISSDSIGSNLNHMSSGTNENGSYSNTSFRPNESMQGGSSYGNDTAWIYSSNFDPNMMPNNNNNGSFSNYNDILNFLSKLNGSISGNGSKNVNEWIQNNSIFSKLMPPGMILNGSGPSGYNINSIYNGSLIDYLNSLGNSKNNSYMHNINSFSGGHNGSFNISNFISGWNNIIHNPNLMNPYAHHNGSTYSSEPILSNSGSSYSNIQNPNLISSDSPNSNGSTNSNGYFEEAVFNGQPNTYGMSSGGHNQLSPDGNNTAPFINHGSNTGHDSMNSSSYNSNIPGVGSGGSSYGGASTDGNSSGHNTNLMGHDLNGSMLGNDSNTDGLSSNNHIPNLVVPDRSTNDSTSGGTGNSTGVGNSIIFNSASSLWTKSGSLLIFSAIGLLVLN